MTHTIHQCIEEYVERTPRDIAIIDQNSTYSYHELNQKANQLAHILQKLEIKRPTVIAIAIERSFELLLGILSILKAGCGYLPIDAEHPKERLHYILQDAKPCILITQSKFKEKFRVQIF